MSLERPENLQEYERWLERKVSYNRSVTEGYYETMAAALRRAFEAGAFWNALLARMEAFQIEYTDRTGYPLFMNLRTLPKLEAKPFESYLEKTFRVNNRNARGQWDREPRDGWIVPMKYDARINDVVRTYFVVKYLDGVRFLRQKIYDLAQEHGIRCEHHDEARFNGGYYAVHVYDFPELEAPAYEAATERTLRSVEIQITTQLKEVIKELVHGYYEERRMRLGRPDDSWAWDYEGEEFSPNYVGHLLHYVEGVITQIKNRGGRNEI